MVTAKQQEAWLLQKQSAAPAFWDPAAWGSELQLELSGELTRSCQLISADVWQNALQEQANALLRLTAQSLGTLSGATSEEFVACALALDGPVTPADQLREQVSPTVRCSLEQRGLL